MSFSIARNRFFPPTQSLWAGNQRPSAQAPQYQRPIYGGYGPATADMLTAREDLQHGYGSFLGANPEIPDTAKFQGTDNDDRIVRQTNEIQPHVSVNALGGNDEVIVRGVRGVEIGTRAKVDGGEGDDTLRFEGTSGDNRVKYFGGLGNDRIVANGGSASDNFNLLGGEGNDVIRVRTQGGESNISDLQGGEGDDRIRLVSTGESNTHQVDGGAGNDQIRIEARASEDTINYKASAGEDQVFINGARNGDQQVNVTLGDQAITILGADGEVYFTQGEGGTVMRLDGIEQLTVLGADGKPVETKFENAS